VVIGGLLVGGLGVASAASPTSEEILAKVNELLTAVGNIKEGNHTQRWDQNLPGAQRFVILPAFNNDAVLDKNTGLVWEKSPAATATTWAGARNTCIGKNVGGQKGWRLSSIPELVSLIDPSVPSPGPTLPPGHPFLNVQSEFYWSATADADGPSNAWYVLFLNGGVFTDSKTFSNHVWCVRGGMNADAY
jgi:hypothetical protein